MRTLRLGFGLGLLALGGCVAAPPPPMAVAPGQAYYGSYCFAGVYQCQLPQPSQAGAPCSCPGLGAPSYGTVR